MLDKYYGKQVGIDQVNYVLERATLRLIRIKRLKGWRTIEY